MLNMQGVIELTTYTQELFKEFSYGQDDLEEIKPRVIF